MSEITCDIVKLIEKSPVMRLSENYQSKFIEKIQKSFTETQQQLFLGSFYCYLNYNSKTDFVINFDDVWNWLGFSRKDPAKRLLIKLFIKDVDYKIETINNNVSIGGATRQTIKDNGGLNKEFITMTINTFKKLCLKANTKKADEIHEYFIKLEEVLQEILNEDKVRPEQITVRMNMDNDKNISMRGFEHLKIKDSVIIPQEFYNKTI